MFVAALGRFGHPNSPISRHRVCKAPTPAGLMFSPPRRRQHGPESVIHLHAHTPSLG